MMIDRNPPSRGFLSDLSTDDMDIRTIDGEAGFKALRRLSLRFFTAIRAEPFFCFLFDPGSEEFFENCCEKGMGMI